MTAVFVHTCNHDSAGRRPHCPAEGEEVDVHGVNNLLEEERDLHAEDLGRFLSLSGLSGAGGVWDICSLTFAPTRSPRETPTRTFTPSSPCAPDSALRSSLSDGGEGGGRAAPTFGHRYRDISLIIPQSAFRCSWVVSSASASKGAFGLGFVGGFFAPTAEAAPVFPSVAGVFLGPLCWSIDAVEAKPRAVRIRAESSDGQRRGALRAIGRRTQAESIWGLEFCRIYGRERGRFTPRERLSHNDADPEPHGEDAPPAARKPEYATDTRKASGGGGQRCIQSAIVIDLPIPAGSDPHRCFSARPRGAVEPHYVDTAIPRYRDTAEPRNLDSPASISLSIRIHDCCKSDPRRLHTVSPMAARRPNSLFTASSRVILPSPGSCARVVRRTASLLPPHLRRNVHIKATPSTSSVEGPVDLSEQTQAIPKLSGGGPFPAGKCTYPTTLLCTDADPSPDVRFEVLGAPYSLLSVALPASSLLYSRRGTLVGINGKTENVRRLIFWKVRCELSNAPSTGSLDIVDTRALPAGCSADSISISKGRVRPGAPSAPP